MNLDDAILYIRTELELMGLLEPDSIHRGRVGQAAVGLAVMLASMCKDRPEAASQAFGFFATLGNRVLGDPLQDLPSAWLGPNEDGGYVHRRCPHLCKLNNGTIIDLHAVLFRGDDGSLLICVGESEQPVSMPYMPKSEIRPYCPPASPPQWPRRAR